MPLTNIGIRFNTGKVVGRWDMPNPQSQPIQFIAVAHDIGYHIALEIARGAEGCFFFDMEDEDNEQHFDVATD